MGSLPKLLGLLLILQFGNVQGDICASVVGGEVVNGQCLTFNGGSLTWTQAQNACASVDGGGLAQLDDSYAAWEYITTNHPGIWYAIGATDDDFEGTWKWIDGKSFVPNPWKGGFHYNNGNAQDWLWVSQLGYDDDAFGYRGQGYICEIAQLPTTAATTKETTTSTTTTTEPSTSRICHYDGTPYPFLAVIEVSCFSLLCTTEGWNYHGNNNKRCGECQVYGDPQFITFDNLANPEYPDYPRWYAHQGVGTFVIAQGGDGVVQSTFEEEPVWGTWSRTWSAARSVCYFEDGKSFCAKLPDFNKRHCFDNSDISTHHDCAIEVTVNGVITPIEKSIISSKTKDGAVLIFKHIHQGILIEPAFPWANNKSMNTQCMNIVGSTGLSIAICTSNNNNGQGAGSEWSIYSHLYVWAMPNLKGKLFGMCDTNTGEPRDGYTMQDRTLTTDTAAFANSWSIGPTSILPDVNKCINRRLLGEIEVQCAKITEEVCKVILPWKCANFIASCVYDLCRVSDRADYIQGYANHLQVEIQLNQ